MFKNKIIFVILFLFILSCQLSAQQNEIPYSFQIKLSGGFSYFETALTKKKLTKFKPGGTLGIYWKPEHLLSIGIESGYLLLYSYNKGDFISKEFGSSNVEIGMTVIPIMLVFSMEVINNLDFNGGVGGYIVSTKVDAFQNEVLSTGWSTGYGMGLGYSINLFSDFRLGLEAKWFYLTKLKSATTGLHLTFKFPIFEY